MRPEVRDMLRKQRETLLREIDMHYRNEGIYEMALKETRRSLSERQNELDGVDELLGAKG